MRRGIRSRRLAAVLALAAVPLVALPQAAVAETRTFPFAIAAADYRFIGLPSALPAADYDTRFFNVSRSEAHHVVAINFGASCQGLSRAEIIALLDGDFDDALAACPGLEEGGSTDVAGPFGRSRGTLSLTPGRMVFVCFIPTSEGIPHYKLGMLSFTDVRPLAIG